MTREEFNEICKWLEFNANSSKFRNVYEMLDRFKLEFNHLLKSEMTFNRGVWATVQCLAVDHKQPMCASFVANDMRITKEEARKMQEESDYCNELMDEVIEFLNDGRN